MMRYLALLPMSIFLVGPLSAQEKKGQDDAKNLQGKWSVVSIEPNGQKLTADDLKKWKMAIEGSMLTIDDGKTKEKSKFTLDPSKKPKHIDFMSPEGRNDGVVGIYELDGDNLKLCYLDDKGKRPTEFAVDSTKRPSPVLMVMKRQKSGATAQPPDLKDGPLGTKFVPLPKGTFFMGGGKGLEKGKKTEITADFEVGVYTVTQDQWQAIMGNNPSWFSRTGKGKNDVKDISDADLKLFPVESVSWSETQEFIKKLNKKERANGWAYRLPTSAEWEYACRGGATSLEECSFHFYFAKPSNEATTDQVNFDLPRKDKFLKRTAKVGSYPPNKLGLHEMHGNVAQWCQDIWRPSEQELNVFRGGGWRGFESNCRASGLSGVATKSDDGAALKNGDNDRGFRLVRVKSAK